MRALTKIAIAAAGLVLAAAAAAEAPGDEAQRVFARISPSVVTIRAFDEQGLDEGLGSGVVIGAGLVATNCHVVREAASLRVSSQSGDFAGKWLRQDPRRDLCILAVDGLRAPAACLRASNSLVVGEPVFAVGNPLGFGLAVSAGLIAVVDTKGGQPLIISSAAQSPGSSGGGLFDRDALLVGITTAVLGTGQNLNLVLSADGLDRLAVDGSPPRLPPAPPAPERRWMDEAIALQMAGKWTELEILTKEWHTAQPSAAAGLAFLGVAQHALNRNQEAVVTLRRALDLDDHYAFAWLVYARALRLTGRPAEANEALNRAESLQPSNGEPAAERAEWQRQDGRLDEANRQIRESIRRAPGRSSAWRTLGLIEDARGNRAEALRAFQTALRLGDANAEVGQRLAQLLAGSGKADEASRVTAQGNQGKDETARTHLAMGLAELQRNRLGPAEDATRKAIALAPELAPGWGMLGTILFRGGRAAEAEKAYDQALKLAPDNLEFLTNRASVRIVMGHKEAAAEDIRRALAVDPQSEQAWRLHGHLQMEARNHREALTAFTKVDGLGKATADDLVSLGESRGETGDVEGALKTLARAEALDPKLVRMCLATARVLGRKGDVAQALTYLERALEVEPSNPVAWSSKGYGLMKQGRLPEAVAALETTVRLAPDISNGWINLGEAQLRSHNLGRAIQALEKAIALAPQALDARLFLAQSYLGARLPAKSREQVQTLLDKQPGFAPGLGLLVMAYLLEGNVVAARTPYLKLREVAPAAARSLRSQAIGGGLPAASQLPE
jgi:tetratricopeptide (TPR) repeat protein